MRKDDCSHEGECLPCDSTKDPNKICTSCGHYVMLDSGYGLCRALPTFVKVPWCRDICGMFIKEAICTS